MKLLKKLEWLPFYDKVKLNKSVLVFKHLQGCCPAHMYNIIKFNSDLHTWTGCYSKLNLAYHRFNRETEATQAAYFILYSFKFAFL